MREAAAATRAATVPGHPTAGAISRPERIPNLNPSMPCKYSS
ncbi:hypothetical protein C7S15_5737 [Burkholderia cepacia]|nr:hypothetical protein [Burkholderia cepacia]